MLMGLLFAGVCPGLCDGLRQVWLSPAASQIAGPIPCSHPMLSIACRIRGGGAGAAQAAAHGQPAAARAAHGAGQAAARVAPHVSWGL